jgi:hypothetical protein
MELEFSREIFENYSNIQFHENPSSGNRVVPCEGTERRTDGKTGTIRRTDMMKLSVFFEILRMSLKGDISGRCGSSKSRIICTKVEMNLLKQIEGNEIAMISIIRPKVTIYVYMQWQFKLLFHLQMKSILRTMYCEFRT